jgi:hypothetical protein
MYHKAFQNGTFYKVIVAPIKERYQTAPFFYALID